MDYQYNGRYNSQTTNTKDLYTKKYLQRNKRRKVNSPVHGFRNYSTPSNYGDNVIPRDLRENRYTEQVGYSNSPPQVANVQDLAKLQQLQGLMRDVENIKQAFSQYQADQLDQIQAKQIEEQLKALLFPEVEELPKLNLAKPDKIASSWNASEVLKDFLFIGAGYDKRQRALVTNPYKCDRDDSKVSERQDFLKEHNIRFFLNMAGHESQKELKDISYDISPKQVYSVPLNDVDSWPGQKMVEALDNASDFITKAYYVHCKYKEQYRSPTGSLTKNPPKVLIHCVAGVNRSAFVVVWWLVKHHKLELKNAWNLVVKRRDSAVSWKDITLGGRITPEKERFFEQIERNLPKYYEVKEGNKRSREDDENHSNNCVNYKNKEKLSRAKLENSGETFIAAKENNEFKKYLWYKKAKEQLTS